MHVRVAVSFVNDDGLEILGCTVAEALTPADGDVNVERGAALAARLIEDATERTKRSFRELRETVARGDA